MRAAISVLAIAILAALYLGLRQENVVPAPVVDAPCGRVSGVMSHSRNSRYISAYRGIPYAEPPVGALRFAKTRPLKVSPWNGVLEATKFGSACLHKMAIGPISWMAGSEDCLYLNVYVPGITKKKVDSSAPLPVMVWIHGGGFVTGDGSDKMYGPKYLLDKDVILVTLNYRLGPLGSLNLDTDQAPGNQALWDQRMALTWVQKNIAAFGGDPEAITLFGESAGAMSVSYHLVSASSNGLFSAAIVQSGPIHRSGLNVDLNRPLSLFHKEIVKSVGCPVDETMSCLQEIDTEKLYDLSNMFEECNPSLLAFPSIWRPSNDAARGKSAFFFDSPRRLVENGDFASGVKSLMLGYNKDEGLFYSSTWLRDKSKFNNFKQNWTSCFTHNLVGKLAADLSESDETSASKAFTTYFGQKSPGEVSLENDFGALTDFFTDTNFAHGTAIMAKSWMNKKSKSGSSLFLYRFDHVGSFSVSDLASSGPLEMMKIVLSRIMGYDVAKRLGSCHADDLFYLFSSEYPLKFLGDSDDEAMSRLLVDLWVHFAQHGIPTSDKNIWKEAVSSSDYVHLNRGSITPSRLDDQEKARRNLWDDISKSIYKFR